MLNTGVFDGDGGLAAVDNGLARGVMMRRSIPKLLCGIWGGFCWMGKNIKKNSFLTAGPFCPLQQLRFSEFLKQMEPPATLQSLGGVQIVPLLTLLVSAGALWGSLESRRFDIASFLLMLKTHSLGDATIATEDEWVAAAAATATSTHVKSIPRTLQSLAHKTTNLSLELYHENKEIIIQARTRLGLAQAKLEAMQQDGIEVQTLRAEIKLLQDILAKSNWHPLQEKQQRLMEFEDQVMGCKVCYDKRVSVVLLPCGHVLCKNCAGKMSTMACCCFCNRIIRDTNVIYI